MDIRVGHILGSTAYYTSHGRILSATQTIPISVMRWACRVTVHAVLFIYLSIVV